MDLVLVKKISRLICLSLFEAAKGVCSSRRGRQQAREGDTGAGVRRLSAGNVQDGAMQ